MARGALCVAAVLCLLAFSAAHAHEESCSAKGGNGAESTSKAGVQELDFENFDELVTCSDDVWVVEFYSPKCGGCKQFKPEFEKAAQLGHGVMKFGAFDITVRDETGHFMNRFDITELPSVRVFAAKKGEKGDRYHCKREFGAYEGPLVARSVVEGALRVTAAEVLNRIGKPPGGETKEREGKAAAADASASAKDEETNEAEFEYWVGSTSGATIDSVRVNGVEAHIRTSAKLPKSVDVAIIGAGPAGVGLARALQLAGVKDFIVLEGGPVGNHIRQWPNETQFSTPSHWSNPFGAVDLNAVTVDSSPAWISDSQNPTGAEYAYYLTRVVQNSALPVYQYANITQIKKSKGSKGGAEYSGFNLTVERGGEGGAAGGKYSVFARVAVWAGGDYNTPLDASFQGVELCTQFTKIRSYSKYVKKYLKTVADNRAKRTGDHRPETLNVVGGGQRGMDVALNLVDALEKRQGKLSNKDKIKVVVFDPIAPWNLREGDERFMLNPMTLQRLRRAQGKGLITLVKEEAVEVDIEERDGGKWYYLVGEFEEATRVYWSSTPPIIAIGFEGLSPLIRPFFSPTVEGEECKLGPTAFCGVGLTSEDESTKTPGLFLVGTTVRHTNPLTAGVVRFRTIHRFRTRFPIVATAVAQRVGVSAETALKKLETYRENGMWLNDETMTALREGCACGRKPSGKLRFESHDHDHDHGHDHGHDHSHEHTH